MESEGVTRSLLEAVTGRMHTKLHATMSAHAADVEAKLQQFEKRLNKMGSMTDRSTPVNSLLSRFRYPSPADNSTPVNSQSDTRLDSQIQELTRDLEVKLEEVKSSLLGHILTLRTDMDFKMEQVSLRGTDLNSNIGASMRTDLAHIATLRKDTATLRGDMADVKSKLTGVQSSRIEGSEPFQHLATLNGDVDDVLPAESSDKAARSKPRSVDERVVDQSVDKSVLDEIRINSMKLELQQPSTIIAQGQTLPTEDIPAQITPENPYPEMWTAEFDCSADIALGIEVVGTQDGEALTITRIRGGRSLAKEWNQRNPGKQLMPGVGIIQINKVCGSSSLMLQEFMEKTVLDMVFIRAATGGPDGNTGAENLQVMELDRRSGESLGIEICPLNGQHLLVEKVSRGAVDRWNVTNPSRSMRDGDTIIEVNNVRGYPALMLEELRAFKPLKISFQASNNGYTEC